MTLLAYIAKCHRVFGRVTHCLIVMNQHIEHIHYEQVHEMLVLNTSMIREGSYVQTQESPCCSHTQSIYVDKVSDKKSDTLELTFIRGICINI